jgi:uncharacterized protein YndB with AHSA1/START domain
MQHQPLVIEQTYPVSIETVWKAITDKDQMKEWYFDVSDFRLEPGFTFTFNGENEGRVFVHLCEVLEAAPLKKLKYSWSYQGQKGVSYLTLELTPKGAGTQLRLMHEGLESFPQDRDFKRENFVEGWNYITGVSLKNFLEKQQAV